MPNTSRMSFKYPNRDKTPWYDEFLSLINSLDTSIYATREDRNTFLYGGGIISFSAITNLLTLGEDLNIFSPISGYKWVLPAGSYTVLEGYVGYIDVTRYPSRSMEVSLQTAGSVPSDNNALLVLYRDNNVLHFRNSLSVADGESGSIFSSLNFGNETPIPSARAASGTNIDITSPLPGDVDDVTLVADDILLLVGQTDPIENGLYKVNIGLVPIRYTGVATTPAMMITVSEGTAYGDKVFILETDAPITIDVTPLTFGVLVPDLSGLYVDQAGDIMTGDLGFNGNGTQLGIFGVDGTPGVIDGQDLKFFSGGGFPGGKGGQINITGGDGTNGGPVNVTAGTGSVIGGDLNLDSGPGAEGGQIVLQVGNSTNGDGAQVFVNAGDGARAADITEGVGGRIRLLAGTGAVSTASFPGGDGGDIIISTGQGGYGGFAASAIGAGAGGNLTLSASKGGIVEDAIPAVGGTVTINSGDGSQGKSGIAGNAGPIIIQAGEGGNSAAGFVGGAGGDIQITAGLGIEGGIGGAITVTSGEGGIAETGVAAADGGAITLTGGAGGAGIATELPGNGGDVIIIAGAAGADGGAGTNKGGTVDIYGGTGAPAGAVTIRGGSGGATAVGADVKILGGSGTVNGDVSIYGGGSVSGALGDVRIGTWLTDTIQIGSYNAEGPTTIYSGGGKDEVTPGKALTLRSGVGGDGTGVATGSSGGLLNLYSGNGGSDGGAGRGNGGALNVAGGFGQVGGATTVAGGDAQGTLADSSGGDLVLKGGSDYVSPGTFQVSGGDALLIAGHTSTTDLSGTSAAGTTTVHGADYWKENKLAYPATASATGRLGGNVEILGGVGDKAGVSNGNVTVAAASGIAALSGVGAVAPGDVVVSAGNAASDLNLDSGFSGGAVSISAGDALLSGGAGGAVTLSSGIGSDSLTAANAGDGGAFSITVGNGGDGNKAGLDAGNGGSFTLLAGAGGTTPDSTPGLGGSVSITAGAGGDKDDLSGPAGTGGGISLTTGVGGTRSGDGGALTLTTGVGGVADAFAGGDGGAVSIVSGNGGDSTLATSAGSGGDMAITSGSAGADTGGGGGRGGTIDITAGDATFGEGGNIRINAGSGITTEGRVYLCNFVGIPQIGRSGIPSQHPGGVHLTTTGTFPSATSALRGDIFYQPGGAGVADQVAIVTKDTSDAYKWSPITPLPVKQPMCEYAQVDGITNILLLKRFTPFDPRQYPTATFNFVAVLYCSVGTLTGSAYLYNISNNAQVTSSTVSTSATTPIILRATMTPGSANFDNAEDLYEVRITNDGTLAGELVNCGGAWIEIIYET